MTLRCTSRDGRRAVTVTLPGLAPWTRTPPQGAASGHRAQGPGSPVSTDSEPRTMSEHVLTVIVTLRALAVALGQGPGGGRPGSGVEEVVVGTQGSPTQFFEGSPKGDRQRPSYNESGPQTIARAGA